ncbi:uncharacterized protein LOC131612913 isoform X2 [Vicia villosa]|uniref:uncharacterized protein LOC131612913 isoform X2 n=1 Tax=Vicia villosa TaxID=3911 RepID=UPI00273C779D|nr:uncharacterized protein LOC131612913 isoform X2 [Vicia villosa]
MCLELNDLTSESGTCDPLCSVDETSSLDFEDNYQPKTDLLKAVAIFAAAATGTTVTFLTYLLKSYADYIRPHEESICKSIVNLLVTCTDSVLITISQGLH